MIDLRKVMNFGRAEAVNVYLREALFNPAEQVFVPVELELRVQAALH